MARKTSSTAKAATTAPPFPEAGPAQPAPVVLMAGSDDYEVSQRSRDLFAKWCAEAGGMDHEIIQASVSNSGEAISALGKLRESLQTLPFFGSAKVIWFKNCNFLSEDRPASAAVLEHLVHLSGELKTFSWSGVRLLISAGKVDKRKTFYKTLEKIGTVEIFEGLSGEDRDWPMQAENIAQRQIRSLKKTISDEALASLVANVGPNSRLLINEIEKLALYIGPRPDIRVEDVSTIVVRNKQARAFALGDALGARDLPRLIRTLDEELWEMKVDPKKSEIGVLYGLISKVRAMLFAKEMLREEWITASNDFAGFKRQLAAIPRDKMAADKRFNPLDMNAYVLFSALPHARNYSIQELVQAMELLLRCNLRLVSSGTDPAALIQETLVRIARRENTH